MNKHEKAIAKTARKFVKNTQPGLPLSDFRIARMYVRCIASGDHVRGKEFTGKIVRKMSRMNGRNK